MLKEDIKTKLSDVKYNYIHINTYGWAKYIYVNQKVTYMFIKRMICNIRGHKV